MYRKSLYILTEEQPTTDGFYHSLILSLNSLGIKYELEDCGFGTHVVIENEKFAGYYKITGVKSDFVESFFVKIISGSKTMVDCLFYYRSSWPTTKHTPDVAVEITKNTFKQSGNMSDQRAAKFVEFKYQYPKCKRLFYLICSREQAILKPKSSHHKAFRTMKTLGVQPCLSTYGDFDSLDVLEIDPYSSIEEMKYEDDLKRKEENSRIRLDSDAMTFYVPLWKSKDPTQYSDPNIGFVNSRAACARELGYQKDIIIRDHMLHDRKFKGNNKLVNICQLMQCKVLLSDGSIQQIRAKNKNHKPYWRYEERGEKIGTIFLSVLFMNEPSRYKILFENHAGCEKSFFETESGHFIELKNQIDYGIPDLIVLDKYADRILVIEGEMSKNYRNGIKQIFETKFKKTIEEVIKPSWGDRSCGVYLTTYGKRRETHTELLFHLSNEGDYLFDKNKKPCYIV